MAGTDWLSYIGAATGVTGAILGYVGYRRSVMVRKLDLRLELRKAVNELRSIADALHPLLKSANQSRTNLSATGYVGGPASMAAWRPAWEVDLERVALLMTLAPRETADYADMSESEVETTLVEIHALTLECTGLRDKYSAALAADDRAREQLRAAAERVALKEWRPPGG